jgi:glycosyltransferase involved in cell wall biosynthesis
MGEKFLISIIYCFRDRELERVKRSLTSLEIQRDKEIEVIFVDYGSHEETSNALSRLLKKYPFVRYFFNDTRGIPWNRAHALNTGIRKAKGDYIFTADIDLVFKSNFIKKIKELAKSKIAYFFPTYLLPKHFSNWHQINELKTFKRTGSRGRGLSLLPIVEVREIKGYDEFFCFWGYEDNDMHRRLENNGIETIFYEKEVYMYHQWHPFSQDQHQYMPEHWREFMRHYYETKPLHGHADTAWGRLILTEERPAISLLESDVIERLTLNGNLTYIGYELLRHWNFMSDGQATCFYFEERTFQKYNKARATRFIKWVNNFGREKEIVPFKLESKYRRKNVSIYDVRDMIMQNIIYPAAGNVKDYFIELDEEKRSLKFAVIKGS